VTRRALVGRDGELLLVDRLLEDIGSGESAVLVISGEAGIGKTSLIGEILRRGKERGYQLLSGRAAEFERELPFAVFSEALEARLSAPEPELDHLDRLEPDQLALLSTVLPALATPGQATLEQAAPEQAQPGQHHRLLRALHALLETFASERPLVLVLDDVHWADSASVDLLCRLLHRGLAQPSLLVLAARPTQTEPRLRTALQEAERHRDARQLELAVLSALAADQLLDDIEDRELRAVLYRQSGGNPFYLQQLAAASEHGVPLDSPPGAAGETGVPATVRGAIGAEVDALSPVAQTLLQGAAVAGEPFEPDLAAEAATVAEQDTLTALDELLERDLIRASDAPRRVRFRHPIVRQAVYETAGAGWLLAAHGRAAAALQARGATASARAYHVERSARIGDQSAVALLTQAGQETMAHSPPSAAHWFEAALALTPEDEQNLQLRLGLLAQHAAALGIAGRVQESRDALREFLGLSPKEPSQLRLQAAVLTAILDELLGTHRAGRRLLLDELDRLPDRAGRDAAELKRELAFTCFLDADWTAMADWARQSLAGECEGMVRVGALAALALAELGLHKPEQMQRSVSEATALFDELSDEQVIAHNPGIAIWLGWAEICSEHFDDAIGHLERCIAISRATGQQYLTVSLLAVQGQALVLTGRGEELNAVAEAATEAALLSASDLFYSWAMTLRGLTSLQAGDLHEALSYGERGVGAAAAASSPLSGIARVQLAATLLEIGEPKRCREQLMGADGELDLPPFPFYEAHCLELLVRAELELGERERAQELATRAEQAARRIGLKLPLAHAYRARAAVLLECGELHPAATAAIAAAEAAKEAGAPVEAARAQILAGKALAAANDRDAAIGRLEAAHGQLISCRAFRYSDEAARELRKLGRSVARSVRGKRDELGPLGLTHRELEVMEQVTTGKTNREIAEGLFLSVRTVDRHLSRIFEKLDVNSRAAASSVFERARSQSPA
jgi:DNA-binding CsgD family transcriptional regulator/ABC-type transport system involved in cytochrome c biogenesis ATPase subunit